jgi:hypothetical protein
MSRNVKDLARTMLPKLGENRDVFEAYLSGTETFADAAIALIEKFLEIHGEGEAVNEANEEKLDRILDRVNKGEDAEAVVREEI